MELYAVSLKDFPVEHTLSALISFVPKEKREKLSRYKGIEDYLRSLFAELLIRVVIVKEMKVRNREVHFGYNAYGKPYLKNYALNFNLSHSGYWVVCAIDDAPIGIDIEEMKLIDLAIAKRFFSNSEWMSLVSMPEVDKLKYFYDLWTLKESYIKNVGLGLSIPLHVISFTVNGGSVGFENGHTREILHFKQYHVDDQYKLSVCSHADNFPEQIIV